MKEPFNIVLVHLFTKERQTVVSDVVRPTYVSFRWGMSGTYDLNLLKNAVTSRNIKARNRGKAHWSAADIAEVRKNVHRYLNGVDQAEAMRESVEKHVAAMPGRVPTPRVSHDVLYDAGLGKDTVLECQCGNLMCTYRTTVGEREALMACNCPCDYTKHAHFGICKRCGGALPAQLEPNPRIEKHVCEPRSGLAPDYCKFCDAPVGLEQSNPGIENS